MTDKPAARVEPSDVVTLRERLEENVVQATESGYWDLALWDVTLDALISAAYKKGFDAAQNQWSRMYRDQNDRFANATRAAEAERAALTRLLPSDAIIDSCGDYEDTTR